MKIIHVHAIMILNLAGPNPICWKGKGETTKQQSWIEHRYVIHVYYYIFMYATELVDK